MDRSEQCCLVLRINTGAGFRGASGLHKGLKDPRYYACRGRIHSIPLDGEKRCDLPFVRADWLEREVWRKVKEVLNDSSKLVECVNRALSQLEERKSQIGAEALAIDDKLEAARRAETAKANAERIGYLKSQIAAETDADRHPYDQ